MRNDERDKLIDVKEVCFICGISREIFDRKSNEGFQMHIKNDHFMWNYIYFLGCLKEKDKIEQNGIETYVDEKVKSFD